MSNSFGFVKTDSSRLALAKLIELLGIVVPETSTSASAKRGTPPGGGYETRLAKKGIRLAPIGVGLFAKGTLQEGEARCGRVA